MYALQSKDTVEISSSNFVFSHLKFIIENFFVDEECTEKWQNSNTVRTGFISLVFLTNLKKLLC